MPYIRIIASPGYITFDDEVDSSKEPHVEVSDEELAELRRLRVETTHLHDALLALREMRQVPPGASPREEAPRFRASSMEKKFPFRATGKPGYFRLVADYRLEAKSYFEAIELLRNYLEDAAKGNWPRPFPGEAGGTITFYPISEDEMFGDDGAGAAPSK